MKIFTDQSLSNEITQLDLGIVEAGKVKKFSVWVLNDNGTFVKDLVFAIDHKEVEILKAPEQMQALDRKEIVFQWSPSVTLKEGLKTELKISGVELWG